MLLFNVNGNWLTDVCQPGFPPEHRFLKGPGPVSVPRSAIEQTRDCPPAVLPPFEHLGHHTCPYVPPCPHAKLPGDDHCFGVPALVGQERQYPVGAAVASCPGVGVDHGCTALPCPLNRQVNCLLPLLDLDGLCHCSSNEPKPHPVSLPALKGSEFPLCRSQALRLLYIDDASCAQRIDLDSMVVPLLQTEGPQAKMTSCGLAIPGPWLALDHKLKDVIKNSKAMGMVVNDDKTKLLMINPADTRQAVPIVASEPGKSLLCVRELRLLGLFLDEDLTWWPLVSDICSRARNKVWSLMRLRDAGVERDVLVVNYCCRVRSVLEYGCQVWGGLLSGLQSRKIEQI